MSTIPPVIDFAAWIDEHEHLLKPPVNNKQAWEPMGDFIVQVVGGPNQRTDFHFDPYEEWFYQYRGNMHVNVMTEDGPQRIDIREGEMWLLPGNVYHSPQRPEAGSIGIVIERIREEGTLEKFAWFCPELRHEGARGRAAGARHRRGPAAGVPRVLRERGRPHLPELRRRPPGQGLNRVGTIDVHTHFVPRGWPDLAAQVGPGSWPWLRADSEREAMIMVGSTEFRRIDASCWDAEARVADMDADGIDVQVVSPTPVFFSYEKPGAEAAKAARIFNDLALEICAPEPDRLLPFAQVPLQDTDAACAELDRAIAAGHAGVEIGNHVGDRDLDHEGIVTFLQHCAERGVPVFVHPWDMPGSPRLDRWMARWLTGMPAETHLSIIALILGGVFDRVPPPSASASPTAAARSRSGSAASRTRGTSDPTSSASANDRRRRTSIASASTRWCSTPRHCACSSTPSAPSR